MLRLSRAASVDRLVRRSYHPVFAPFLRCGSLPFSRLARCWPRWRDAAGPPSQGHSSSPAALNQMPRCMADSRDSIVPGQFSFPPDFDAELPAVPAPERVSYQPHQLHISTSRELLAYPWWPCASAKTGHPHIQLRCGVLARGFVGAGLFS